MNLGCLEQSWCVLGVSGMRLGCVLERLESILEVSWAILERLEVFLEGFWRVLEASWELSGSILCHFGQYAKIAKNLGKTMVFH